MSQASPIIASFAIGIVFLALSLIIFGTGSSNVVREFHPTPLLPDEKMCSSPCIWQLNLGNSTYPVNYRLNGNVQNMTADQATKTLTIELNAERPTSLQIAVPRDVVDSKLGPNDSGADFGFAVFVDEIPVDFKEMSTKETYWKEALGISDHFERYRILLIPIEQGSKMVEIVSTLPA